MWTESSSVNCKFGKYICYNFRDIKFFLGVTFLARPVYVAMNNCLIALIIKFFGLVGWSYWVLYAIESAIWLALVVFWAIGSLLGQNSRQLKLSEEELATDQWSLPLMDLLWRDVCDSCGVVDGRGGVRRWLLRHGDVQGGLCSWRGGRDAVGPIRSHGARQVRWDGDGSHRLSPRRTDRRRSTLLRTTTLWAASTWRWAWEHQTLPTWTQVVPRGCLQLPTGYDYESTNVTWPLWRVTTFSTAIRGAQYNILKHFSYKTMLFIFTIAVLFVH